MSPYGDRREWTCYLSSTTNDAMISLEEEVWKWTLHIEDIAKGTCTGFVLLASLRVKHAPSQRIQKQYAYMGFQVFFNHRVNGPMRIQTKLTAIHSCDFSSLSVSWSFRRLDAGELIISRYSMTFNKPLGIKSQAKRWLLQVVISYF